MSERPDPADAIGVIFPTGMLGGGFSPQTIENGIALGAAAIAVDAGSTDSGPHYLGTGTAKTTRAAVERDLRILLIAARRADTPAGKLRGRIQPLQRVAANGPPSGRDAIKLGNPDFEFAELLRHSGKRELRRPRLGLPVRHSLRRQFDDRLAPDLEETGHVIQRSETVNIAHVDLSSNGGTKEFALDSCQGHDSSKVSGDG